MWETAGTLIYERLYRRPSIPARPEPKNPEPGGTRPSTAGEQRRREALKTTERAGPARSTAPPRRFRPLRDRLPTNAPRGRGGTRRCCGREGREGAGRAGCAVLRRAAALRGGSWRGKGGLRGGGDHGGGGEGRREPPRRRAGGTTCPEGGADSERERSAVEQCAPLGWRCCVVRGRFLYIYFFFPFRPGPVGTRSWECLVVRTLNLFCF